MYTVYVRNISLSLSLTKRERERRPLEYTTHIIAHETPSAVCLTSTLTMINDCFSRVSKINTLIKQEYLTTAPD